MEKNKIEFENEAQLQTAVINYIKALPHKIRYCASLGGQYQKHISQRKKAKATGYVPGFPDLQICEARGGYFGLFIEIKLDKRCYASGYQKDWIKDLNDRGYKAKVCKGFDECRTELDNYFNLSKTLKQE